MLKTSPLAPDHFPDLPAVAGVAVAGAATGLKRNGRPDLMLATFAPETTVAGVFTRSLSAAAPVLWCRQCLSAGARLGALVINSGNANAFTGKVGREAVAATAEVAAQIVDRPMHEVMVASTGVIGVPLPDHHIPRALPDLHRAVRPDGWADAARAIMTTDTFPKGASRKTEIGGIPVTLVGIAKGSGMIAPDMATTLGVIATDAAIPAPVLQRLLDRAADRSFNSVTVDGDTSTSDSLILAATGQARHPAVTAADDRLLRPFRRALEDLAIELAQLVVRDGEGASKFVSVSVTGAASARAARRIGLAIANSPLVKTAIAGEDPNWGRIVMAVGKAGEKADPDRLAIAIGGIPITEDGRVRPDYDEVPVAAHMKGQEIDITVDVGVGRGRAQVWTCDLTHGYIEINADYRS